MIRARARAAAQEYETQRDLLYQHLSAYRTDPPFDISKVLDPQHGARWLRLYENLNFTPNVSVLRPGYVTTTYAAARHHGMLDILEWCAENCGGAFYGFAAASLAVKMSFERDEDAVLYRLAFADFITRISQHGTSDIDRRFVRLPEDLHALVGQMIENGDNDRHLF